MGGGMHHMQQFSNMGGGREEVTVRQYTAPHAGFGNGGMGEPNIFVFNQKTACYKKEVEITFENAYLGCKQNINFERFL
jgi:DnaJ-class molecular chaperone